MGPTQNPPSALEKMKMWMDPSSRMSARPPGMVSVREHKSVNIQRVSRKISLGSKTFLQPVCYDTWNNNRRIHLLFWQKQELQHGPKYAALHLFFFGCEPTVHNKHWADSKTRQTKANWAHFNHYLPHEDWHAITQPLFLLILWFLDRGMQTLSASLSC